MRVRELTCLALALASGGPLAACGAGQPSATSSASPPVPVRPSGEATVAETAKPLAEQLAGVDSELRRAIEAWHAGRNAAGPTGGVVSADASYLQRVVRMLAQRPGLETATLSHLPLRLRKEVRSLIAARRELARLSAGWPAHHVATGAPQPIATLLRYYRDAQGRFGVRWQVLAAINFVESGFGRVHSASVAGAQGPMQFMPATWRTYGLGGNVNDPHDAILGAANLLHQAGAPADYAQALYAYNPSPAYVDAVKRYARVMAGDPDAVYLLYSWKP